MAFSRRLSGYIARRIFARPVSSRGVRPVASITFDDFPKSAWTVGGAILARYGARSTYYVAGSMIGCTTDGVEYYNAGDLAALRDAGHEIGSHGFGHEPTSALSSAYLASDLARNTEFLKPFLNGDAPVSYAFPFGDVSWRTKRICARQFSSARGVHHGVNDGTFDLALLNTVAIETYLWREAEIAHDIVRARERRGWIVFHTHDVSDNPTAYGCTPPMLESVLQQLDRAGIQVLPMCEALRIVTGDAS